MEDVATDAPTSSGPIAPRKLAYDRLLLPVIKLKNSASSKQLEQRLNYLWSSSHAMLLTSPALAHNMASTIMETARVHRLELPAAVLDYLCPQCGGLTVPSISADIRVVSQHHKSKLNRKIAQLQRKHNGNIGQGAPRRERLRNALQVQCHRCGYQNLRHGATVVHKPKTKKPTNKRPLDTEIATTAAVATDAKRAKKEQIGESKPAAVDSEETTISKTTETEKTPLQPLQKEEEKPRSIFAKPPSSPRRLLDTKKKKKKSAVKDAAASAQVKSSLDSLLSALKK